MAFRLSAVCLLAIYLSHGRSNKNVTVANANGLFRSSHHSVARASSSRLREPGSESFADVFNLGQVLSICIAPDHSDVTMSTLLYRQWWTLVCEQSLRINSSVAGCLPEKSRWCPIEQVSQEECKLLCATLRVENCAI